jgi:hypothetical protein
LVLVKPAARRAGGWPSEASRGRTRYGKALIKHGGTGAREARNSDPAPTPGRSRGFARSTRSGQIRRPYMHVSRVSDRDRAGKCTAGPASKPRRPGVLFDDLYIDKRTRQHVAGLRNQRSVGEARPGRPPMIWSGKRHENASSR